MERDAITTAGVCELLACCRQTVYRLARRWKVPRVKLGRATRWSRRRWLLAFEAAGRLLR